MTPLEALERVDQALRGAPDDPQLMLQRARCLLALGRRSEAFEQAARAERRAPADPGVRDAAGTLYSFGRDQQRALAAYDAAVALAPHRPEFKYNRASVRRFLGDLAGAERDYDAVVAARPDDYEAYKNRSDLRIQTPQHNHVRELTRIAGQPIADWRGVVQLGYALAKEYEDLGDYARSFECLSRAAAKRREHMNYDVANDVATVQWIIEAFPGAIANTGPGANAGAITAAGANAGPGGGSGADPIFVIGLPRSGTTWVERILGSHRALFPAGELDCFAQALTSAVQTHTGRVQMPRRELVANSAAVDFCALGRDYLRRARRQFGGEEAGGQGRFIDKMPLNYLYCGLIRRALPQAKLVHVMRHPMASCYAMLKTLFRDGYPFSYDLRDLAEYYIAYRRLMAHWQATLPGEIHTVSYEALVADPRGETARLLEFCGLEWDEACARPHENPAASTTASAAQVRRALYDTSVSQWRHYELPLAPLRARLEAAGIEL
jgi:tetratricopeptide (TPR) repeat protein